MVARSHPTAVLSMEANSCDWHGNWMNRAMCKFEDDTEVAECNGTGTPSFQCVESHLKFEVKKSVFSNFYYKLDHVIWTVHPMPP